MDSMMIKNAQGEQVNINVVRYFRLNGIEYLVFSLNEVDEGGYVKLYISKINGNFANTITDDVEWNLIKDTIKNVIKSNKENMPLMITDLDIRKLSNVQIVDQKVFKLSETFIQLLSANKHTEQYEEPIMSSETSFTNIEQGINLDSIQSNPIIEPDVSSEVLGVNQEVTVDPVMPQVEIPTVETNMVQQPVNEFVQSTEVETPAITPAFVEQSNVVQENTISNLGNNDDYGLDYKTLYENELNKNQMLTVEIEKYKNIINNLKKVINETETF